MRRFNNAVLRGIFAVLLGIILILWPEAAIIYIIMIIGDTYYGIQRLL